MRERERKERCEFGRTMRERKGMKGKRERETSTTTDRSECSCETILAIVVTRTTQQGSKRARVENHICRLAQHTHRAVSSGIDRQILVGTKATERKETSTDTFRHFKYADIRCRDFAFIDKTLMRRRRRRVGKEKKKGIVRRMKGTTWW